MKKLILSIILVLAFALYSVHVQTDNESSEVIKPTNSPTPQSTSNSVSIQPTDTPAVAKKFKDGQYTGQAVDVFYGLIQVRATVSNGQLTDIEFLQHPNDRRQSVEINQIAMPVLRQEAIQNQNAQVDIVSGATDSSQGFIESLGSALAQAK